MITTRSGQLVPLRARAKFPRGAGRRASLSPLQTVRRSTKNHVSSGRTRRSKAGFASHMFRKRRFIPGLHSSGP